MHWLHVSKMNTGFLKASLCNPLSFFSFNAQHCVWLLSVSIIHGSFTDIYIYFEPALYLCVRTVSILSISQMLTFTALLFFPLVSGLTWLSHLKKKCCHIEFSVLNLPAINSLSRSSHLSSQPVSHVQMQYSQEPRLIWLIRTKVSRGQVGGKRLSWQQVCACVLVCVFINHSKNKGKHSQPGSVITFSNCLPMW